MDTELLTVSQTAQYLQLSEKTIRRMIEKEVCQLQSLVIEHGELGQVILMII